MTNINGGFNQVDEHNVTDVLNKIRQMQDNGAPIILPGDDNADQLIHPTDDGLPVQPQQQPPHSPRQITDPQSQQQQSDPQTQIDQNEIPIQQQQDPITDPQSQQQQSDPQTDQNEETIFDLGDGRKVPISIVRELVGFDDFIKNNPVFAQRMQAAFNPDMQIIPTSELLQRQQQQQQPQSQSQSQPQQQSQQQFPQNNIPQEVDFSQFDTDDPTTAMLVQNVQQLSEQNRQFQAYLEHQQQQQALHEIDLGVQRFREINKNLSADDIDLVRRQATELRIINNFVGRGEDLATATQHSLEYAMWSDPNLRDKMLQTQQQVQQDDLAQARQRQQKLSALAGTNGNNTPISAPAQETTGRAAFVHALAQQLESGGQTA